MQSKAQSHPFLTRVVPLMLVGFGTLHVFDWAYVGFADQWKLINGFGLTLLGGASIVANRIEVTGTPSRARSVLLAVGVFGFAISVAAMVHSWL